MATAEKWKPKHIMTDFEQAFAIAVKNVFPACHMFHWYVKKAQNWTNLYSYLSYFHFRQAVSRWLKQNKYAKDWKRDLLAELEILYFQVERTKSEYRNL